MNSNSAVLLKNIEQVQRHISFLEHFLQNGDKKIMQDIGKFARKIILKRTRSGKDVHGVTFNPLISGERSTLTKSGDMLKDMKVQSTPTYARIYIGNNTRGKITNHGLMLVHNEGMMSGRPPGFKMPKREFMGFGSKDVYKIKQKFEDLVAQKLKSLNII